MKRTPLRRFAKLERSPFKRRSRISGQFDKNARSPIRRSKPKLQRVRKIPHVTLDDKQRLDWLHRQPCAVTKRRPVDVHHHTQHRGLGQKSSHDQGIPLHHDTHMDFHAGRGFFKGWDRARRREWQTELVAHYQAAWDIFKLRQGIDYDAMRF